MKFLEKATNYMGLTQKNKPSDEWVPCPVCNGYGMWNLQLDAYGHGKHFQAACSQCNSYGYVPANSLHVMCIHEMKTITHITCTYHKEKCTKCGYENYIDSSG